MVIIPLLTMVIVSYQSYQSIVTEQSTRQTLQTLEQVSVGLDREASQIMNTVGYLYKDENLLAIVNSARDADKEKRNAAYTTARTLANNYFQYTNELMGIIFFFRGGGTLSTNNSFLFNENSMRTSLWYNKSLADKGNIKLLGVQPNYFPGLEEKYINTAAIAIPDQMSEQTNVEAIYFIFQGTLFQHLFDSSSKQQGDFLILDNENRAIAANRETYIQNWLDQPSYLYKTGWSSSDQYTAFINGNKVFITYYTAKATQFKIIHIIPYSYLTSPLKKVFVMMLWIGATSTSLFLLASWFVVRTINRPIIALVRGMSRVQTGSMQLGFEPSGPAEVYQLGSNFIEMVSEMDVLIKAREEHERAKAMAELQALQSQINPHFLLNTLNAIKLMAVISKAHNIQHMTDAFIRLLSSTFNRGGMLHSVKEEMDYLKQYLYIMEFRYGSFEVNWDLDERIMNCRILKQLIQPIVENAIVHGLHRKENGGKLSLFGHLKDSKVVITVEDDGEGIHDDDMKGLFESDVKDSFSGLGMRNVHERIRLHYGEAFGLYIASKEGEGTRVEVHLPIINHS